MQSVCDGEFEAEVQHLYHVASASGFFGVSQQYVDVFVLPNALLWTSLNVGALCLLFG